MTKNRSIVTGKAKKGGLLTGMGKVGALTIPVTKGWESSEVVRASELALMFSIYDMDDIYSMCREAGFAEYPETGPESQETLATRYTGAWPSIDDAKEIPASRCWLMIQFCIAHNDYLEAEKRGDFRGVMEAGYILGRLTEWWRWRSEGHDLDAMRGHQFPPGQTKKATKAKTQKAKDRAQHVIEFAQRLLGTNYGRFASGRINQRKLARQFLTIVKPRYKESRVRQIIRAAVRSGELA